MLVTATAAELQRKNSSFRIARFDRQLFFFFFFFFLFSIMKMRKICCHFFISVVLYYQIICLQTQSLTAFWTLFLRNDVSVLQTCDTIGRSAIVMLLRERADMGARAVQNRCTSSPLWVRKDEQ